MNDDSTGITFLYFDGGSIQSLNDKDFDTDFHSEFCIHLDSHDHTKLEAALRKEPYDCTTFNENEMGMLRANFNLDDVDWNKPSSMTDREWKEFLGKLS
jgi:hypothetical protein